MGFALGQKIDARLKVIEARLHACEVEEAKRKASTVYDQGALRMIQELQVRIEALEAKRGPGRPKATDGK